MRLGKILALLLFLLIHNASACQILEVLPNPDGDDGREYVRVYCDDSCVFTDHESFFNLSAGEYYITNNRSLFYSHYGFEPDFEGLRLSNSGEEIQLICGNRVDSFDWSNEYRDSGVIYYRLGNKWDFRYEDWSNFSPVRDFVSGRIIITPAEYILKGTGIVASYTVTQDNFEGDFEFIVDANPVGGIPAQEIILSRKYRFHFLEGPYENFHYKFAVLNETAIITTENWKWDNRGVIVEIKSKEVSDLLRKLYEYDLRFESEHGNVAEIKANEEGGKGRALEFEGFAELHVMPDSNPVFDFIEKSEGFLYIAVPYMDFGWFSQESPLLNAIVNASKKHEVKVMLSDYKRNEEVVEFLNSIPNVSAKIVRSPEFDDLHGKYLITEGKVLITSANFNKYGLKLNRELALIVESEEVSNFMKEVFEDDWENKKEINSAFSLVLLGTVLLTAFYLIKRLI